MFENTESNLKQLVKGAFVTSGNAPCNVMTIGWGFIGYMWRKPIFIAPVRQSRYTKEFIDRTGMFAVSVPREGEKRDELKLCGTKSGRDIDKIALLETQNATKIDTKIIADCASYYECKVLGVVPLTCDELHESVHDEYSNGDMHVLYIGEIL